MFCPNGATYTIAPAEGDAVSQDITFDIETGVIRVCAINGNPSLSIAFNSTATAESMPILSPGIEYLKPPVGTTYISVFSSGNGDVVQITEGQEV